MTKKELKKLRYLLRKLMESYEIVREVNLDKDGAAVGKERYCVRIVGKKEIIECFPTFKLAKDYMDELIEIAKRLHP